jgi:hypothetical protein
MRVLGEEANLTVGVVAIDLAAGANAGKFVSMKGYNYLHIIIAKEAGATAEGPIWVLEQATAVAGTNAKALGIKHGIYSKNLADVSTVAVFTKLAPSGADLNTHSMAAAGDTQALIAISIKAEDLDVEGGFDCVGIKCADTGATVGQLGTVLYLLTGSRYGPAFSAIAD